MQVLGCNINLQNATVDVDTQTQMVHPIDAPKTNPSARWKNWAAVPEDQAAADNLTVVVRLPSFCSAVYLILRIFS